MTPKQKSNRDFIAKIKTLNIGTGAKPGIQFPEITCQDCGLPMKPIAAFEVKLHPINMPDGDPKNN